MILERLRSFSALLSVACEQQEVIRDQRRLIDSLEARIQKYKDGQRLQHLHHSRHVRDLLEQFFLAQMSGADVTAELEQGLNDLRDEVARLEEHAPR